MGDRSQTEDTLDEPGSIHKAHARDDGHDVIPEVHEDEPADPAVPVRRDEGLAQPAHRRGMPVRSVGDDAPIAKAHESINSFMHSIVGPSAFFMQQGLHAHGESLRSKADDASTGFSMPWCTLPSDTDGETDDEAAPGSDGQGEPAARLWGRTKTESCGSRRTLQTCSRMRGRRVQTTTRARCNT